MFAGRSILSWATANSPWPTVKWYGIRLDWWPGKTEHLVNYLQHQDVHRDGGFDDGHCLWYTHRELESWLATVFFISEDSLGFLAQSQLLSEICDSLMPAQYCVLHSCLGANIPAKWGMTKLGPTAVSWFLLPGSIHVYLSIWSKHSAWKWIQTCRISLFSPVCLVSMLVFPHSCPSATGMLLLWAQVLPALPRAPFGDWSVKCDAACLGGNWRPPGEAGEKCCGLGQRSLQLIQH